MIPNALYGIAMCDAIVNNALYTEIVSGLFSKIRTILASEFWPRQDMPEFELLCTASRKV